MRCCGCSINWKNNKPQRFRDCPHYAAWLMALYKAVHGGDGESAGSSACPASFRRSPGLLHHSPSAAFLLLTRSRPVSFARLSPPTVQPLHRHATSASSKKIIGRRINGNYEPRPYAISVILLLCLFLAQNSGRGVFLTTFNVFWYVSAISWPSPHSAAPISAFQPPCRWNQA